MSTTTTATEQLQALRAPTGPYVDLEAMIQLRFCAQDLDLSARKLSQSLQAGQTRTRFRGRGMEFEEVRHYQAGDDIRSIDWRVTARTQVPHTKLYREERERPVLVVTDQRPAMFFGSQTCFKSVTACYCAALIAWAALKNNDRIGGLIFNDVNEQDLRPKRSRHSLLALLRGLHEFNQGLQSPLAEKAAQPLSQRLSDLRRIAKPGSALFIISDFHDLDEDCREQLYQLSRHCEITLLPIHDPLEATLPTNKLLTVSDGVQRKQIDSSNSQARYQAHFQQQQKNLKHLSGQLGLGLLPVSTTDNPITLLQQQLGARACRR
ncbi:DUF58 domain-containing protein [Maricurvus nonylphenolicus]|uniref:DUF58 domain-containing protein n=1 Tax=Maricurvus nonylphenolicus TaxID=1008307 RepID=UPI0036F33A71